MPTQARSQIATIDCSLVTIEQNGVEFGFDTATNIQVEPQIVESEATQLIIKDILRAQKLGRGTLTGNQITLTDNVFNAELVLILQGGVIQWGTGADINKVLSYTPPLTGSITQLDPFIVNAYSAQYDAAGRVVNYEKISYPNCQGVPVAFGAEDGVFRTADYTINSAAAQGEAPYKIMYVDNLPVLT